MPKIDMEAERERMNRIFDDIAGKMPEEPKKTPEDPKTDLEEILCRQYQNLFRLSKVPGYLNAEVNLYRHFVAGVIAELDRCTGLAKEHDNHHYYKVFADYVRKHLEKL